MKLTLTLILSLCATLAGQTTQYVLPPSSQPWTITITAATSTVVVPSTPPPVAAKMAIGTNLAGNDPWQTYAPWCDVARQMSGWFPAVVQGCAITGWTTDSYPTGVSLGGVARANMTLTAYPSGVYTGTWTGTKDGLTFGRGGKQFSNITGDGTNWTGTVTFNSGDLCELQQTGGQTNIHLYAPDAVKGLTFRKAFTDALRPYKVLRLMPWARPNSEMDQNGKHTWPLQWVARNLPTNWDQTSREVALEYQFQLAKESGCTPWINTYWGEDDDALTQTAKLAASNGFPSIIVEPMGNEPWNMGGGYQGNEIRHAGQAAGVGGDLNVAGARYTAQQGAHAAAIFRSVLGNKVKVVFSAQATWGAWAKDGLSFVPPGSFDAIGIAPYFNNATTLPATATVADWEASSATWINTVIDNGLGENQAVAQASGVELWCYEAGQSYFPLMANPPNVAYQDAAFAAFNADFITKFQADPAMGRLYDLLFAVCRKHNVTEFTHFYLCGYWGRSGYWGAKQFLTDPENEKTKALARAIAAQ